MIRRILLLFVCAVVSMSAKAQFAVYKPVIVPNHSQSTPIVSRQPTRRNPFSTYTPVETVVTGTTYNAIVLYESSTGYEATYRLRVVVNNGYVKKICFDNGGSVHVGINNSGYKYYGGELEYIKDLEAYVAEVTIVYDNSWKKYTVVIQ